MTKIETRTYILVLQVACSFNIEFHVVEGAHEDKDHLLVKSWDVVPHHEDDGSELTGNRNCVFGVLLLVLIGTCLADKVPIDDVWLDTAT